MEYPSSKKSSYFDAHADCYEESLNRGISISGEDKEFFARGRISWLAACARRFDFLAVRVLDFGCGAGTATPYFFEFLNTRSVLGIDVSQQLLEIARQQFHSENVEFDLTYGRTPNATFDLAFCNGVFHHILPQERAEAMQLIFHWLRPGGVFAMWENNPYNPGTRYVMSRIPFDRDAIMLSAREARATLRSQGFQIMSTDYLFVFPRWLSGLRFLEPHIRKLFLGAQYQVLAQKPKG